MTRYYDSGVIRARICAALGAERDDWLEEACRLITARLNTLAKRKIYDVSTLGGRMRAARELAGMTQRQAGRRVNEHPARVAGYELGLYPLPARKVPGFCMTYGVSVPWMLGTSEEGGPKSRHGILRRATRPCDERKKLRHARERAARLEASKINRARSIKKLDDKVIADDTLSLNANSTQDTSSVEASEPEEP